MPEVTQPGSGRAETGTRQSSRSALESLLSEEGGVAQWSQPESDAKWPGPFVPNLLCDEGCLVPSVGLRLFTYQQRKGAVWQDGSQVL